MLQIIGFILCGLAFVKALEIAANPAYINESGERKAEAGAAMFFAFAIALIGSGVLYYQGKAFDDILSGNPYTDASEMSEPSREWSERSALSAAEEAEKAADEAVKAAEEAIRAAEDY